MLQVCSAPEINLSPISQLLFVLYKIQNCCVLKNPYQINIIHHLKKRSTLEVHMHSFPDLKAQLLLNSTINMLRDQD